MQIYQEKNVDHGHMVFPLKDFEWSMTCMVISISSEKQMTKYEACFDSSTLNFVHEVSLHHER